MWLKKLFTKNKETVNVEVEKQLELSRERIAQHEAAHGIVWYLFRDNWVVKILTIERNDLPDEGMNGALHISPSFNINKQNSIEKANELFAIALAGMIGQNINLIKQRHNIMIEIGQVSNFDQILDTTGCSGDFELARKYLDPLAQTFGVTHGKITYYKILDLINMFQNYDKVQKIHAQLTQILLEKGRIYSEELTDFFEGHNFIEYIEDNNLDIFFHRKS